MTPIQSRNRVGTASKNDPKRVRAGIGASLRRPWFGALVALTAVVATISVAAGSAAPTTQGLHKPAGLRTFMASLSEPKVAYSRTPAFAWLPVRGATHYEFELSTSNALSPDGAFRSRNAVVWSSKTLTTPATAIPLALPWITGSPWSLYWHVRAKSGGSLSQWSSLAGFNMSWPTPPQLVDTGAGYIGWAPVKGATGYQVWFVKADKIISTDTNVADLREWYIFHDTAAYTGDVEFRLRAVRRIYGHARNALPAVSFGPWSKTYHKNNPANPLANGQSLTPSETVSDIGVSSNKGVVSTRNSVAKHTAMPVFLFSGSAKDDQGLHRIYVFSDRRCVNPVYRGAIVGGPAYAPRTTGPLDLPKNGADLIKAQKMILKDGLEGITRTLDLAKVSTNEANGSSVTTAKTIAKAGASSTKLKTPKVDLWDRAWSTQKPRLRGLYYWTVVPVKPVIAEAPHSVLTGSTAIGDTTLAVAEPDGFTVGSAIRVGQETVTISSVTGPVITVEQKLASAHEAGVSVEGTTGSIEYRDMALAQDMCQSSRSLAFGKHSIDAEPNNATGLSPNGRLLSAATGTAKFYGQPLIAWNPATAAGTYDVEWSKKQYPFSTAGHLRTPATSAVLPLTPGVWFYRVRGINYAIPGNQKMQWSNPARIEITKPVFATVAK